MYKGIKKKEIYKSEISLPTKVQMIVEEEEITNGIIRKQLKVKTIDYKSDPNIKYTDFEVNNLLAAGVDVYSSPTITMETSKEKILQNADAAENTLEQLEIIKEFEQTLNNNGNTTETTQAE